MIWCTGARSHQFQQPSDRDSGCAQRQSPFQVSSLWWCLCVCLSLSPSLSRCEEEEEQCELIKLTISSSTRNHLDSRISCLWAGLKLELVGAFGWIPSLGSPQGPSSEVSLGSPPRHCRE